MHWLVVKRLYTWGQEREVQNKFISTTKLEKSDHWDKILRNAKKFRKKSKNKSGRNPREGGRGCTTNSFPHFRRWKNLITQKVTENWSAPIGWSGNIGRNSSKHLNIITHAWSEERVKGRMVGGRWGGKGKRWKRRKWEIREMWASQKSNVLYITVKSSAVECLF